MRDLVSLMSVNRILIQTGFKMNSKDEEKERNEPYFRGGISEYTRIISSSNPGYVLRRKIK